MWSGKRKIVFEFSHWISDWESHRGKRFRRASLKHVDAKEASIFTVIVRRDIVATQLREVESFFESEPDVSEFRFISDIADDPAGAELRQVSVGDLVVDVDISDPGFDPGSGFFGMNADDDSEPRGTT